MNNNFEKIPFVPLTFDYMFKRIFTLNQHLLKDFLISVLKLDMDPDNTNIIIENSELTKTIRKEYHKTVDILVLLNNKISIDVELNSSSYYAIKYRNALYIEKIMTTNLEQGTSIGNMDNYFYYQLNLNIHKFKEDIGEKNFYFKEDKTNELLISNLKVIHKSLDYYTKLYYNKVEKRKKDEIWLALINAKSFNEIKEMANLIMEKSDYNKFIQDIEVASRDKLVLSEWEADKMAELVKINSLKEAKEEGFEKGTLQGIEQTKKDTIIAMLKKNISKKDIEEITGKSLTEIEIIENSLK